MAQGETHRSSSRPSHATLLLEIGTEEIPARFFPGALSELEDTSCRIFDEYRVDFEDISTYATPRRLVLIVNKVSQVQKDEIKEVLGPSKKAAFDKKGNPTKAAAGFARSVGIAVTDLSIKQKDKGEYVTAIVEAKGVETKVLLPEMLHKIIVSLHFPKTMRWGGHRLTFARPIRWIVSLFGSDPVRFEIDGINSGTMTRGHRFLSPAVFQIKDISSFIKLLKNNFVVLDQKKRRDLIRDGMRKLFVDSDREPIIDKELLDTVTYLVEYPVPVRCSFDADYLKLPKELLITVMKDHQKYFAVDDRNGNLTNDFIVISNTRAENAEIVRIGAERVIKARFDDAKFYYHDDTKRSLVERTEDLKQVTFHDKIGTIFEKTERLALLSAFLSEKLNPSLKDKTMRACHLSKSDLVTGVVREFPELQGSMGKYYALHDKEDGEVAIALEEQYFPHSLGSRLPETDAGAFLSLSDKIDTVSSFFAVGLIPTGSEDPFALRRHAMGIISIILDRGYTITLQELFDNSLAQLSTLTVSPDASEHIMNFMTQRLEFILSSMDYPHDAVQSVLSLTPFWPLKTIIERLDSLKTFREEAIYPEFLLAIKRVHNILPAFTLPPLRNDILLQDEEKGLYDSFSTIRDIFSSHFEKEDFYNCLLSLAQLTQQVNIFFDRVLVMDKQEEIRLNRLSLLRDIWSTASLLADFSKLL